MNQSQQQHQEKTSFLESYSNKIGMVMDKLCFSYIQEFDGVSLYEDRTELMRRCHASYELPDDLQDFQDYSNRTETLPIQNIKRTHWLLQSNSFIVDVNDDDAPRDQAPMTPPTKTSIFKKQKRENSCDSLDVFCSPAVHKPTLRAPSPSDTYTTVSISMSMSQSTMDEDEDDEDRRSTTSDDVVSQLFRPKLEHSTSSLKSGANDHESYQYLLRMKPQNYIHGGDEDRLGFQQLKPAYRNDCLGKKTLSIGNLGKENSMRNLGCNPPTRKQVSSTAA
jgi:hypothetical protein